MMQRLAGTAAALGTTLQDAVKAEGYYFGTTMEHWAAMAAIRATYFHDPGPVATVVPCHLLHPEGAVTRYEITGLRTALNKYIPREDCWPDGNWDWTIPVPYRQGLRLRGAIWTGGQVPFVAGRSGKPVHVGDLIGQTRYTMGLIEEIVKGFGKMPRGLPPHRRLFHLEGHAGRDRGLHRRDRGLREGAAAADHRRAAAAHAFVEHADRDLGGRRGLSRAVDVQRGFDAPNRSATSACSSQSARSWMPSSSSRSTASQRYSAPGPTWPQAVSDMARDRLVRQPAGVALAAMVRDEGERLHPPASVSAASHRAT